MNTGLKVLIADDHKIFRDGMVSALQRTGIVAETYHAQNGKEALKRLSQSSIDLLFMDLQMPKLNGIDAIHKIYQTGHPVKIVVVTAHPEAGNLKPLLNMGVGVILDKGATEQEILYAMQAALEGSTFYSTPIEKAIHQLQAGKRKLDGYNCVPKLTKREKQLLPLLTNGMSNKKIAKQLSLSAYTVADHRQNIFAKFDVHNLAGLIKKAIAYGLINE